MSKTQKDLLLAITEKLDPEYGELLRSHMEQVALPNMKKNKEWDKEMSDEEFDSQLKAMEKEIPYIIHHLQTHQYPKPPSDHQPKN